MSHRLGRMVWLVLLVPAFAQAQPAPDGGHLETPEDAPAPAQLRGEATSPRAVVTEGPYRSVQVNVTNDGANILRDAANEPSIAVDPTEPDRIAIGWRQFDTIESNFRQAGWAYTLDGGFTWTFPGTLEPGVFRSDPVLDYDADGVFYFNSLSQNFTCQYFISSDGGQSWAPPVQSYGGDKQWSAIDRTSGIGRGNIYLAWSPAAGCCGDRLFTRSTDGGASFMEPIALPASPMWGTLAVAPNGNLFICGRAIGGLAPVMRSSNAQDPLAAPTFPLIVNVDIGGDTRSGGIPNPGGLLGTMWIACEPEGGPHPENVYLLGSVDPPGADPLDLMFARSTDGGVTWEPPVRVNDDAPGANAYQWFGTLSVAPNGRIDAVWNDTRDQVLPRVSRLFYSSSSDGGVTWSANVAVSPAFDPALGYPNQQKIGDYYHAISHDGAVHVAYAATFTGGHDVYYLRIPIDCNENGASDAADVAAGTSLDCNTNGVPDECDRDCNHSGVPDDCEVQAGLVADCDNNGSPDDCDIAARRRSDCDASGVPDVCELAAGTAADCNGNAVPDACDVAAGPAGDCNANVIPDVCEVAELAAVIIPPAPAQACVGGSAEFTVAAPGATGYQWRRDGVDIPNADHASLLLDPVEPGDEALYSCRVFRGCIAAESGAAALRVVPLSVEVTLRSPANIATCTQDGTAAAAFAVELRDADGALYQWSRDGVDLIDGGRISGAQGPVLNVSELQPDDVGVYTCRAWNVCLPESAAVTTSGVLTIIDPVFVEAPKNVCAEVGGAAVLHGSADAPEMLVYRWYEGDLPLSDGSRFSGASTDTLTISAISDADAGRRFRLRAVLVDPPCSTFTGPATLIVQAAGGCVACPQPGDLDGDGDYDLLDAYGFMQCFGTTVAQSPECGCANVRGVDDVIDSADWVLLETILTGPQGP